MDETTPFLPDTDLNGTDVGDTNTSDSFSPLVLAIIVLQLIFAFLILSSNTIVIAVFVKFKNLFRSVRKYCFILAVVDLLTGFAVFIQVFYFYFPEALDRNKWFCILRFQSIGCLTLLSQVTIFMVSVERFLSLNFAVYYNRYAELGLWKYCLMVLWFYVLILFLYPLLGANNWSQFQPCMFALVIRKEQLLWMAMSNWVLGGCMIIMYIQMWHQVRKRLMQVTPAPANQEIQVEVISTNPQSSQGSDSIMLQSTISNTKVAFVVTTAFTLCWVPFSIVTFLDYLYPFDLTRSMTGSFLTFLGVSNSFMNPFIYTFMKRQFRYSFKKFMCSACYRP